MQFGKVGCPVTSLFTLNQLLKNPLSEFFALNPSTEELVLHSRTNLDVPFSLYINFLINVDIQINTSEQYFRHASFCYSLQLVLKLAQFAVSVLHQY